VFPKSAHEHSRQGAAPQPSRLGHGGSPCPVPAPVWRFGDTGPSLPAHGPGHSHRFAADGKSQRVRAVSAVAVVHFISSLALRAPARHVSPTTGTSFCSVQLAGRMQTPVQGSGIIASAHRQAGREAPRRCISLPRRRGCSHGSASVHLSSGGAGRLSAGHALTGRSIFGRQRAFPDRCSTLSHSPLSNKHAQGYGFLQPKFGAGTFPWPLRLPGPFPLAMPVGSSFPGLYPSIGQHFVRAAAALQPWPVPGALPMDMLQPGWQSDSDLQRHLIICFYLCSRSLASTFGNRPA
jgi:hypothetical protein